MCLVDLKPEAKAVAEFDAICDQYERALRSGADSLANARHLDQWLERVSPHHRSWLRAELMALRAEFCVGDELAADKQPAATIPLGVHSASWKAVTACSTFQHVSHELQLSLARRVEHRQFDSGAALLRSGQRASGLYLITAGRVQVIGAAGESRYEIDTDEAGSVLGEMSVVTGYPCTADVVAATPVQAFVLPLAAFDALCSESPELEIALSQLISDRLGQHAQDALCGKSLGGYRLQRCVGRGAMGVVYAAEQESSGSLCALKMLRHRFVFSPSVISRFDQETNLLRNLEHPNVVAFRGHFVAYRTRFIVLDLYDGADLHAVIQRQGPIDESTVRAVLGQIAAGLQYAHAQGILHLDLKPANVLIDRQGQLAITDFGLSRLIESGGGDQDCVGTPLYMPPEQFMMADIGPHCDWYSFACIGYELISGKRLFSGDEATEFLDDKFRTPSADWPQLAASEDLAGELRSALEPMVDRRQLNLAKLATWARPVPELAVVSGDAPFTVNG